MSRMSFEQTLAEMQTKHKEGLGAAEPVMGLGGLESPGAAEGGGAEEAQVVVPSAGPVESVVVVSAGRKGKREKGV